jgi:excinuclease ABC subunit A
VLQALVDKGNSVIVVEHDMDVIKSADWVIDIGPEGGARGGVIVAEGTPEDVASCSESHTGQYLAQVLQDSTVVPTHTRSKTSLVKVSKTSQ